MSGERNLEQSKPRRPGARARRLKIAGVVVGMSCAVTGAMSLLFHGEVRLTMMLTGIVCAVVVDSLVSRITKKYRDALRQAKRELEDRVAERTADLRAANEQLTREAAERMALQQHLVASDRMATAGAMAAAISHEIRNPLMAIICNLDFARNLPHTRNQEAMLEEALEGALEGAAQVQRIAADLATLANPRDDDLEAVDVGVALSAASRLAAHHLHGVASLSIKVDSPPRVIASAPRLVQVFLNLITNAAQATAADRPNEIVVTSRRDGSTLAIEITDSGKGIAKDKLDRVFEPFFTTKKHSGGTGLGMSICRSIVESCGGTMSIASAVGEGTTISLGFVIAAPPVELSPTTAFELRQASA